MPNFLVANHLSAKIREIAAGADVRCAVAYWGEDCDELIGTGSANLRIICDAVSGGTSPKALIALGAPDSPRLRHLNGLHAKVYISDRGAVICSANASNNGIGFGDRLTGSLIEAGVWLKPKSPAWTSASSWFEELFRSSQQIDDRTLAIAKSRWRPANQHKMRKVAPTSIIELAAAEPQLFDGIGFVFAGSTNDPDVADRARQNAAAKEPGRKSELRDWSQNHMFLEWESEALHRWPSQFFSFYKPATRLHVSAKRLDIREPDTGTIFATPIRLRPRTGGAFPGLVGARVTDANIVQQILDAAGGSCVFATASALVDFLIEESILRQD